jgi:hypothetical protein
MVMINLITIKNDYSERTLIPVFLFGKFIKQTNKINPE